jgi:hypothetical protein
MTFALVGNSTLTFFFNEQIRTDNDVFDWKNHHIVGQISMVLFIIALSACVLLTARITKRMFCNVSLSRGNAQIFIMNEQL